jgi:hypothetical protein
MASLRLASLRLATRVITSSNRAAPRPRWSGVPPDRARASPRSHQGVRAADGRGGPAPWQLLWSYIRTSRGMGFNARGSGRAAVGCAARRNPWLDPALG